MVTCMNIHAKIEIVLQDWVLHCTQSMKTIKSMKLNKCHLNQNLNCIC